MTLTEIITNYLNDNGYDGLCTHDCGCFIGDLFPCGSDPGWCKPGYKKEIINEWGKPDTIIQEDRP